LRNPLGAVLLSARTLLRTEGLSEPQCRAVQRIAAGAERMGRMINELLDLTRARLGGGIPLSRQPVELRGLCQQVLEELETAHPGQRMQVHAEGNLQGEWDADRLSQLLGNLVKNALDYSPEGTPVDLALVDEGECVRVEVHNQGPPIPEEYQASLFEPFRRVSQAGGSASSGLGLGLFIADQIVRAHGGSITVHSSAGAGTTFSVRLPRHAPGQGEPACGPGLPG
jgi:signal transduction histidine kinase